MNKNIILSVYLCLLAITSHAQKNKWEKDFDRYWDKAVFSFGVTASLPDYSILTNGVSSISAKPGVSFGIHYRTSLAKYFSLTMGAEFNQLQAAFHAEALTEPKYQLKESNISIPLTVNPVLPIFRWLALTGELGVVYTHRIKSIIYTPTDEQNIAHSNKDKSAPFMRSDIAMRCGIGFRFGKYVEIIGEGNLGLLDMDNTGSQIYNRYGTVKTNFIF
ncbi:hypothetical protein [Flammeovirga kamogawensis]|uniref:PorT family protein n=1 Tax=Flammeovirga kamogawensis TaxID=373891 RepID=A0ABX8GU39_9BACT|nr:hypothetical protein [Flammeovirga kamogawensis]MBB6463361.1 hypothetical protein [Flammeovirga kamogawensis]QWG06667.1 hypothetical protein KM029_15325 [Flammeovirga kamogawensis]TRX68489.1 hypothetical protein EO216_10320 [Flammeovirga kamogawensis]